MDSHIHWNIIHNRQNVQPKVYLWMNEANVLYTYNEILFNFKAEGSPALCNSMDEPEGHRANWNQPVTEGYERCHSDEISKTVRFMEPNWNGGGQGLQRGSSRELTITRHKISRNLPYNIVPIVNNTLLCT